MRFTQNLFNLEVEEVVCMDWSEHHCGIGSPTGASDSNNTFISTHQPTISRHHGNLTDYLHPLTKDTYPRCPLSVNLVKIVERFDRLISYDEIQVDVLTEERHVSQKIAAHEGISSLMGLVIATSECPHTDFFKPMARFHLPFATHEETIWRAIGTYLITQYFLNVQGKGIDLQLDGLTKIYDNIEILNAAIVKRLRDASKEDSTINALIHLDIFAKLLAPGLQESLNILQKIFTPF